MANQPNLDDTDAHQVSDNAEKRGGVWYQNDSGGADGEPTPENRISITKSMRQLLKRASVLPFQPPRWVVVIAC